MEITQEERLDLTDIKKEKEAFAKCIEDKIKTLLKDTKGSVIIDTKDLYAENQRLKAQLDKEIHINRTMKNVLEKYADPFNDIQPVNELAKQVLKEIDNKE